MTSRNLKLAVTCLGKFTKGDRSICNTSDDVCTPSSASKPFHSVSSSAYGRFNELSSKGDESQPLRVPVPHSLLYLLHRALSFQTAVSHTLVPQRRLTPHACRQTGRGCMRPTEGCLLSATERSAQLGEPQGILENRSC
ncbi:hypothetical protein GJAV_G00271590 [Gymnothorax javanicus]|nr:hypothetical protein GJAV_G00271590 [Gymnothorax javanicus]